MGDFSWYNNDQFKKAFFFKGTNTLETAKRTLNDIVTYSIWRYRCKVLYEGREHIIPSVVTANNIWLEFTSTIMAILNHIKAKANWWVYRDSVQLVSKQVATQNQKDIGREQAILSSLLLDWERPKPGSFLVEHIPTNLNIVPRSGHGNSLPPTFPSYDMNWKLRITPKPTGKDTLDIPVQAAATSIGTQSSSSGSTC